MYDGFPSFIHPALPLAPLRSFIFAYLRTHDRRMTTCAAHRTARQARGPLNNVQPHERQSWIMVRGSGPNSHPL